jgi:5-methylcytosine-specific restriction enzyme A
MKPCAEPGCPKLILFGARCPEHKRQHNRQRELQRGDRHERGYGSEWTKLSREIIRRDEGICYLCGLPGADTADHVVAKARGGSDDPSNLRAAHRACNSAKGAR